MRKTTLSILFASTALAAAPAYAQQAASQPTTIGEIVVTAQRVASSAQTTPVALTVYNGQQLAARGITNVQALQTIDPSVNVVSSSGAAYVAVRGIASTDVTEIGDPSVPIARDGFFTNRSFNIASSFYDLQRVEVLKGPQGTLFGRNSTGGLISVVTQRPSNSFGGYVAVEGGSYSLGSAEAAVNVPIGDKVQLRVSGFQRYHQGYRELTGIDQRGDDDNTYSGRVQLAFQPFDGFTGLLRYQHDFTKDRGDVSQNGPLGEVTTLTPHSFTNLQPTFNRIGVERTTWEFNYDKLPGHLTLTYQGGYDKSRWNHQLDATDPAAPAATQVFTQTEAPDTWNHEVRISTPSDGRFTFQGGYFHFQETNNLNSGLLETGGAFADRYLIHFNYNVQTKSDAVFGQASYKLLENLRFSVGGRYTWDDKTRVGDANLDLQVASGGFAPPIIITTPGNGHISESRPTYHLGLDWTPTPLTLIYAKYDTGYKSGGFNSNGSAPSVDYGPESLKALEIGTKNRFFDKRLLLNLDFFYQKYAGYQASQTTAVISSGSGVFNIGSAKIYGAEAEIVALIDHVGRFDANATLLHARFDNDIGPVTRGDTAATQVFIGGNALPNAPDFAMSVGFEHPFDLAGGVLTPRIEGKYSSDFYFTVFNDPDNEQKAYATGNLLVSFKRDGAPWQVQAYVRNFTDATVLVNAARNYISNANTYEFAAPRTWGMRVNYTF